MDRVRIKILVGVAAKSGENPLRRRGKDSSATFVSRGLVGPKAFLNRERRKGNRLIFLYHNNPCLHLPHLGTSSGGSNPSKRIILWSTVMVRNRRKRYGEGVC